MFLLDFNRTKIATPLQLKSPEIQVPILITLFKNSSVKITLDAQFGIKPIMQDKRGANILLFKRKLVMLDNPLMAIKILNRNISETFESISKYDSSGKNLAKIIELIIEFLKNVLISYNCSEYFEKTEEKAERPVAAGRSYVSRGCAQSKTVARYSFSPLPNIRR